MKIRKSSNHLTAKECEDFVSAFKKIKQGLFKGVDKPSLDDFADEHAAAFKEKNHDWLVHSHDNDRAHWGLMFFAWHRVFLNEFENRLRREVAGVTIPYWNAFRDPFPSALKKISDNEGKSAELTVENLPDFSQPDFEAFQNDLEVTYHNPVHANLARTMGRRHSPRDAAFWLHHAFVDRQWGHWFEKHNGATPPNIEDSITGDEIVRGKRVKDVLHTTQLDYVYANGIFRNVERRGSDTFADLLEKDMILCANLGSGHYAKIFVYQLTSLAAFLTLQQFPFRKPGVKKGIFPPSTTYCDLLLGKFDVPQSEAHIQIIKKVSGSNTSYMIKAMNGTRMSRFTGITDFTANRGAGATDFEMLYI